MVAVPTCSSPQQRQATCDALVSAGAVPALATAAIAKVRNLTAFTMIIACPPFRHYDHNCRHHKICLAINLTTRLVESINHTFPQYFLFRSTATHSRSRPKHCIVRLATKTLLPPPPPASDCSLKRVEMVAVARAAVAEGVAKAREAWRSRWPLACPSSSALTSHGAHRRRHRWMRAFFDLCRLQCRSLFIP